MSPLPKSISASTPWEGTHGAPEISAKETAARKTITYGCERGHPHQVVYAADAVPPGAVWCRCGGTARLPGAPRDAVPEGGEPRGQRNPETEPMAQLRKRRDPGDGDELIAWSLERRRRPGAAT